MGGRSVNLVEMTPKDPAKEVYAKTVLALDPKDLLILRREFFDKNGDKVKVWTIDKVEQIDGIWTLTGQEMQDLKGKTKSRLDVSDIKYARAAGRDVHAEVSDALKNDGTARAKAVSARKKARRRSAPRASMGQGNAHGQLLASPG